MNTIRLIVVMTIGMVVAVASIVYIFGYELLTGRDITDPDDPMRKN